MRFRALALPSPGALVEEARALKDRRLAMRSLFGRRDTLLRDVVDIESQIHAITALDVCGGQPAQHVELYDGTLGVRQDFVAAHEGPVGQLMWQDAVDTDGDSPASISGVRWGTGALFADDLFLTAGHCFDPESMEAKGWIVPTRNGIRLEPAQIAQSMNVNFGYQVDGLTKKLKHGRTFPIAELLELGLPGGVDYAIVRLEKNTAGESASERFGNLTPSDGRRLKKGMMLCIIQHPNGDPKKVEAGPLSEPSRSRIGYNSLDARSGASGAPVLSAKTGEIVGVHIEGGCAVPNGISVAQTIGAIRGVSDLLP